MRPTGSGPGSAREIGHVERRSRLPARRSSRSTRPPPEVTCDDLERSDGPRRAGELRRACRSRRRSPGSPRTGTPRKPPRRDRVVRVRRANARDDARRALEVGPVAATPPRTYCSPAIAVVERRDADERNRRRAAGSGATRDASRQDRVAAARRASSRRAPANRSGPRGPGSGRLRRDRDLMIEEDVHLHVDARARASARAPRRRARRPSRRARSAAGVSLRSSRPAMT